VWLTDLEVPDRKALGLTSDLLDCDRLEHRVVVDVEAEHWPRYARRLPLELRRRLELAAGARPMHWYVSEHPVPVAACEGRWVAVPDPSVQPPEGQSGEINIVLTFADSSGKRWLAGALMGPLVPEGGGGEELVDVERMKDRAFTLLRFTVVDT
jgi:hypothetical protein